MLQEIMYMRSVKAKRKSMEQENASSAIYQRIEETSKSMESSFPGKVGLVMSFTIRHTPSNYILFFFQYTSLHLAIAGCSLYRSQELICPNLVCMCVSLKK